MRIFWYIGIVVLLFFGAMAIVGQVLGAERLKITDENRQVRGYLYDPGHGRRTQILDDKGRVLGYIESDGDITDRRRRKVGEIEDLERE